MSSLSKINLLSANFVRQIRIRVFIFFSVALPTKNPYLSLFFGWQHRPVAYIPEVVIRATKHFAVLFTLSVVFWVIKLKLLMEF